jgi:hypothetical protein
MDTLLKLGRGPHSLSDILEIPHIPWRKSPTPPHPDLYGDKRNCVLTEHESGWWDVRSQGTVGYGKRNYLRHET